MERSKHSSLNPALHVSAGGGTFFVVASAADNSDPNAGAREVYASIAAALRERNLAIVQERIFGSLSAEAAVSAARREALVACGVDADGPYTYLQGRPVSGEGFAGVIVRAVPADCVRLLMENGRACGRAFESGGVKQLILQNIQGIAPGDDNAPASQATRAIQCADRILRENGAGFRNVARTWFYLADILSWYGEFNAARNAQYGEFGLMPAPGEKHRVLPASTGIRADVPGGAACTLDLLAVVQKGTGSETTRDGVLAVQFLRNPRQQEAYRYGSAFSRCAVIHNGSGTLIELSGTASIDESGKSLYQGDIRAQVRCTLERVSALIAQGGATLHDIAAATIFLKYGEDADAAREVIAELGLERVPAVWVVADVCREELLFEIDAELIVTAETQRTEKSN